MNADLWIKVGTLVLSLIGAAPVWKLRDELLRARRGHLRDEYKFAAGFLAAIDRDGPAMHPYLKQKGYEALVGGTHLATSEIEYLLSLHEPVRAIEDFSWCKKYLIHRSTAAENQIGFADSYERKWRRMLLKLGYFAIYISSCSAAVAPILLPSFKIITTQQLLTTLPITLVVFLPISFLAIRAGTRISRAEALITRQHKQSAASVSRHRSSSITPAQTCILKNTDERRTDSL